MTGHDTTKIGLAVWLNWTGELARARLKVGIGLDERRPNGLAFSCRERAAQGGFKKGTISRAKRSTAMPCWTAALVWAFSCDPVCLPQDL